ncbi:MAG: N-acetyl-gamma-glutamyl-phosphate reductase [Marinomonas sp.]
MTISIFIDGAAGTTGLEIRERLEGREEFSLLVLDDDLRKDEAARKEALHSADAAILCLPDDAARDAVALASGSNTRIIDASSAHRTAPDWTYGFPELVGQDAVASAQYVANPGCYPTGFLAMLVPLVRAGMLPREFPYSVNAVSGYSGGGNALISRFEDNPSIAFRSYGLGLDHKHLPEMQKLADLEHAPVFAPAVVPAHRGMLVEIPLALGAIQNAPSPAEIMAKWEEVYGSSRVISLLASSGLGSELLLEQGAKPWDGMELMITSNDAGTQARLIARLDNLGKGASGAAIQNLNLMFGLEETSGLRL